MQAFFSRVMNGKEPGYPRFKRGDRYDSFTSEYAFDPSTIFHPSEEEIGIDLGINSFAVLSDGTSIENPRY
jgi:transposase